MQIDCRNSPCGIVEFVGRCNCIMGLVIKAHMTGVLSGVLNCKASQLPFFWLMYLTTLFIWTVLFADSKCLIIDNRSTCKVKMNSPMHTFVSLWRGCIVFCHSGNVVLFAGHQQLFSGNVDAWKSPRYISDSRKKCGHTCDYQKGWHDLMCQSSSRRSIRK